MKKNVMMRLASLVLALTLMSTCALSGTFAKYVTTVSGDDEARTAVWDITADTTTGTGFAETADTLFQTSYNNDMVKSSDTDKVVAPGTSDSVTYGLTGTPETAYTVTFGLGDNPSEVTLNAGTYTFSAPYADSMNVTVSEGGYKPLAWTVTITSTSGTLTASDKFSNGVGTFTSLSDIKTALGSVSIAYNAGVKCDAAIKIEWKWDADKNTTADTVLGYYAAVSESKLTTYPFKLGTGDTATNPQSTDATLKVSYDLTLTATQNTATTTP